LSPEQRRGLDACAALARRSGSASALCNLGTVHLKAGDASGAESWFREAVSRDPDLPEAHQNLAALLADSGRPEEAQWHRDRAFRTDPLRIETAAHEQRRVLVLSSAGYGNVPIDNLLPRATTTRIKLFVAYATEAQWAALPPYDIVFNAIGDADLLPPGAWWDRLPQHRILNEPACVARTRRDRLPCLLADLDDVVVPKVARHAGVPTQDLRLPAIVRPIGAHGGKGVTLVHTAPEIPPEPAYLTEFHDYRSPDGLYRKYRMIFVGGIAFPAHLAISSHWLVHYFSADMAASAWKRDEERAFLDDPAFVIGGRAMTAVAQIGRRLDLDYAGVDFSVLPDGRVLVFEANATMAVNLDDDPALFDYRHRAVRQIFAGFADLFLA
jgi:hypothetical protein